MPAGGKKPNKNKDTRPGLSRQKILIAAAELADAEGIEKLSMRRLAQSLGVEAMSLYNHVKNKDELLQGLIELVLEDFYWPKAGADWQAEMRQRAIAAHEALVRHPWASMLIVSNINPGPNALGYVDATLGCLTGAGFSYQMADRIWNAMDSHIYGFTLQELRFPFEPEDYIPAAQAYLPMIPESLPHMRALTIEVAEGRHYGTQDFTFGLDLLLDAVARLERG